MNGETAGEKYRNGSKIKKEQRDPVSSSFPRGGHRTRNNMNKPNKLIKSLKYCVVNVKHFSGFCDLRESHLR